MRECFSHVDENGDITCVATKFQELHSALVERDHAICERNELLEKYCHEVKDKAEAQKELDQACKDIETVKEERDVARKERTEAIIQRDQLLREYYQARQVNFALVQSCFMHCHVLQISLNPVSAPLHFVRFLNDRLFDIFLFSPPLKNY